MQQQQGPAASGGNSGGPLAPPPLALAPAAGAALGDNAGDAGISPYDDAHHGDAGAALTSPGERFSAAAAAMVPPLLPIPTINLNIDPSEVRIHREHLLGDGAFGVVFKGTYRGSPVAVKQLNSTAVAGRALQQAVETFQYEMSVLSRLDHRNIVRLHGACMRPPAEVMLVMELMQQSLHSVIHRQQEPLPLRRALQLAADVAHGLACLHPAIVHRDLKPENVLIDEHGTAKISDFGLARYKPKTYVSGTKPNHGTVVYMAPECFEPTIGGLGPKTDMYSFGVLLWELLSGEYPWHGTSSVQIMYRVAVRGERLPRLTGLPHALPDLLEACLSRQPSDRPDATHVRDVLEDALRDLDTSPLLPSACRLAAPGPAAPARPAHLVPAAGAAAAAAAAAAAPAAYGASPGPISTAAAPGQQQQQQPRSGGSAAAAAGRSSSLHVPVDYVCPVTRRVMRDPVVLVDSGHTYEREAIERHLALRATDPLTSAPLLRSDLTPDAALRGAIAQWLAREGLSCEGVDALLLLGEQPAVSQQQQQQQQQQQADAAAAAAEAAAAEAAAAEWAEAQARAAAEAEAEAAAIAWAEAEARAAAQAEAEAEAAALAWAEAEARARAQEEAAEARAAAQARANAERASWQAHVEWEKRAVARLQATIPPGHRRKDTSLRPPRLFSGAEKSLLKECGKDSGTPGISGGVGKLLKDASVNPNVVGKDGWTPLHLTALFGHTKALRVLVAAGADAGATDENGHTPLHYAAGYGHSEAVRALVAAGANMGATNSLGSTPLHWAAFEGYTDAVRALLVAGADLGAKDKDGWTPLHLAAFFGHAKAVRALVAAGAAVGARGNDGATPLHRAAYAGALDAARVLLAAGASKAATNNAGRTPRDLALEQGRADVSALLAA